MFLTARSKTESFNNLDNNGQANAPVFSNFNSKYIEFTNDRTAKKTFAETEWVGAMCQNKAVNGQLNEFSIRIDRSERFFIQIGYAQTSTIFNGDDLGYNETKTSWMCNLANGKFKNGGVCDLYFADANTLNPRIGVVYTIYIDLLNDLIYLTRNGQSIGEKLKLQISQEQKLDISPCIDILEQGDQVTII